MRGLLICAAAISSDKYALLQRRSDGTPSRANSLMGDPAWVGTNVNFANAYPAIMLAALVYFGSVSAVLDILDTFTCASHHSACQAQGLTNMLPPFSSSRASGAPTRAQIENACRNWRYCWWGLSLNQATAIFVNCVNRALGKTISGKYNGVGVGSPR